MQEIEELCFGCMDKMISKSFEFIKKDLNSYFTLLLLNSLKREDSKNSEEIPMNLLKEAIQKVILM